MIPKNVAEIPDEAFQGCTHLREVAFPEDGKVVALGRNCFRGCALERFEAPPVLRSVGPGAFAFCRRLRSVELDEARCAVAGDAFRHSGRE